MDPKIGSGLGPVGVVITLNCQPNTVSVCSLFHFIVRTDFFQSYNRQSNLLLAVVGLWVVAVPYICRPCLAAPDPNLIHKFERATVRSDGVGGAPGTARNQVSTPVPFPINQSWE